MLSTGRACLYKRASTSSLLSGTGIFSDDKRPRRPRSFSLTAISRSASSRRISAARASRLFFFCKSGSTGTKPRGLGFLCELSLLGLVVFRPWSLDKEASCGRSDLPPGTILEPPEGLNFEGELRILSATALLLLGLLEGALWR